MEKIALPKTQIVAMSPRERDELSEIITAYKPRVKISPKKKPPIKIRGRIRLMTHDDAINMNFADFAALN